MPLLKLQNIEFSYSGPRSPVISIENLLVKKGERVFIHGPSGCGKTTLLEILAGVLVPQKGTVSILDQNISQLSASSRDKFRAAHIGYIFQSFNLIPYLNVQENIALPLHLSKERRRGISKYKQEEEIQKLCKHLEILDLISMKVNQLSVGQQQRVAVARALLGKPELILADEPTSSLDQDRREKFIQLLFDVSAKNETTVLFVSHDRSIEKLFDRAISLPQLNKALVSK